MSNDSGLTFWVGDVDGFVTIWEEDRETARLEFELDNIGEIKLLAGKAILARDLSVSPSEWGWAVHKAEHVLGDRQEWASLEPCFVAALLALGRPYAIARYAKWERLPYPSAITATVPLGLKALINQFLLAETLADFPPARECVQAALHAAQSASNETAYQRTARLQAALHEIADAAPGHSGRRALSRDGMRTILSLARLHFSAFEAKVDSFPEVQRLVDVYDAEWTSTRLSGGEGPVTNGRKIRGWPLRHIRPLIDLYPYALRHAISRGLHHYKEVARDPDRSVLVNELALAHCGIIRMRRAGRDLTRSR